MSADDSHHESGNTAVISPVTIFGHAIRWDDNVGTLEATNHELAEYMIREGHLQSYLENHTVSSGSKTIVDSTDAIFFLLKI